MVASFLILPVSASDVFSPDSPYDFKVDFDYTNPDYSFFYISELSDFVLDLSYFNSGKNIIPLPFSGSFYEYHNSSSEYFRYEYFYPNKSVLLNSGSVYLLTFSNLSDSSTCYFSFPKSLEFAYFGDLFPETGLPPVTIHDNVISFDCIGEYYGEVYILLFPKNNYNSFDIIYSVNTYPLTPPDTSMPPFKVVLSSLSEYVTTNFSWGSKVFEVVSSSPGLLILCLAFPIIGFLLGWMRRLINGS